MAENTASIRVMQKAGLKFEKRFTCQNTSLKAVDGREAVEYALERSEFSPGQYAPA